LYQLRTNIILFGKTKTETNYQKHNRWDMKSLFSIFKFLFRWVKLIDLLEHMIINRTYSTNIAIRDNYTFFGKRAHEFNVLMNCIREQNQMMLVSFEIWRNLLKSWWYCLCNKWLCLGRTKTIFFHVQTMKIAFHSQLFRWELQGMNIVAIWLTIK
jgi:hypothetical protein